MFATPSMMILTVSGCKCADPLLLVTAGLQVADTCTMHPATMPNAALKGLWNRTQQDGRDQVAKVLRG
jgi:hypothetical protein